MPDFDVIYADACKMIGECCLMFAYNGEEVSLSRITFRLERAQEVAIETHGEPDAALKIAIAHLKNHRLE
ncbi:hypothetical protein G3M83_11715 [Rouxiella badensis]|uniref:hypothetical protein n=1 Tax=Rouxiella badensis TaxID=1646377 RepID=UPI0013EF0A19|nr:hypothetical protein [Rouxiella badensis]QII38300.1 hypothetical protein G3M83_11715 [Rouxiella badensis]